MSVGYRLAVDEDMRLVVRSWMASYRYAHAAGLIAMRDWVDVMTPQIERVLSRPGCEVWVAYDPDDDDSRTDLYGWIAVERGYQEIVRRLFRGKWEEQLEAASRPLVHYVYVKSAWRDRAGVVSGVSRGLFAAASVDTDLAFNFSCKTAAVTRLKHRAPLAEWKPLIARHEPGMKE